MSNNSVEYLLSLKDKFSSGIKSATTNTEKLNGAVNQAQKSISGLGAALGVGLGAAGIVSFGKAVVDSLVNYQYFSSSLRTLMNGDAEAAKALETQLVALAKTTPFSLVEIQDATKQLLAYGFAAGKVTKNIKMLGDVASALKIPFGDIAYLYGTLKTQGRAFAKDINQFTGRGIPIVAELAKQFGVAESEIMKMVEEGKVGFKEVEKAFQSMTAEGGMFFNMMAEQTKTVGGQISALGDSYEQLKVNIGKSQDGIIASTVSFADRLVATLSKAFSESNQEFDNFAKYGAEKFKSSFNPLSYFEIGARAEQTQYQKALNMMYVDAPAQTLNEAIGRQTELFNLLTNVRRAYNKKEIDEIEFGRKRATVLGAIEAVRGQIGLLQKTPAATTAAAMGDKGASSTSTAKGGTSTNVVESRGVQNFNIDINKLVENINIQATTIKEGAGQMKEAVAQALIEAVNDFQLMATK
jgi:tape measure domain-containing protein